MTDLRLALLVLALVVLLALFLWARYRARVSQLLPRATQRPDDSPGSAARPVATGPTPRAIAPSKAPSMVVTVRLVAREPTGFPAERLVAGLRGAGLQHGQFGIFHRHGDSAASPPLFSVASLVEPGSFDLTRLQSDHYPGVSLFLALPGPPDAITAFDRMIATARTLARELDGDLLDEQGSTLSVQRERYLREEVIQFSHRRQSPA